MILKKLGDEYKLYSHDSCIATTYESPYQKLSLKNCEAIENGYDLDELFESIPIGPTDENGRWKLRAGFITGFQKALEILGDKKFSEEDILIIRNKFVDILPIGDVSTWDMIKACKDFTSWFDKYIQSLQQTEWEVTFNPDEKDSEGCLILKRKI